MMPTNIKSTDFCQFIAALDPDRFQHAEDKANAKEAIKSEFKRTDSFDLAHYQSYRFSLTPR